MKTCSRCGEERPRESFSRHNSAYDGLQPWCKPCTVEHKRELREEKETEDLTYLALIVHHDLSLHEMEVAREVVAAIRSYRSWYGSPEARGNKYTGDNPNDVVKRLMPSATDRRQSRVLSVAIALAWEWGTSMTSRRYATDYREGEAA